MQVGEVIPSNRGGGKKEQRLGKYKAYVDNKRVHLLLTISFLGEEEGSLGSHAGLAFLFSAAILLGNIYQLIMPCWIERNPQTQGSPETRRLML